MVRSLIPSSSSKFQKPCQPIVEKTVLNSTFKRALLDREVSLVLLWVEQETTLRIHCSHRGYNNCTMMLLLLALFIAWHVLRCPRESPSEWRERRDELPPTTFFTFLIAVLNGFFIFPAQEEDTRTRLGQQRLALVLVLVFQVSSPCGACLPPQTILVGSHTSTNCSCGV